jgi:hypothetical protein
VNFSQAERRKHMGVTVNGLVCLLLSVGIVSASPIINLGTAGSFAVLGGSTVTNTGLTAIQGNLGLSPGTSITGFPPGTVSAGIIDNDDAAATQAQTDLTVAYLAAAALPCGTSLTGQDLGGLTLTPGVYCFASSAQLTGKLTLNAEGNANSTFVFQIGSTLTTASGSSVVFTNDGQGSDLFWQVGSSATLGTTTAFTGNILAQASITLNTGATIDCGSALAQTGAVTLDTNSVDLDDCPALSSRSIPEPALGVLLVGLGVGFSLLWRQLSAK